jgi:glutathione S-transferase
MMKLHFHPASPFVRMVRIVAHEVGLENEIELVETGGLSPIETHRGVASANPLGKLPALVTGHGHALYDSRVISEYLAHRAGRSDLVPDEPVRRFRALTLQALALGIADAGVAWRYEMVARPEAFRWEPFAARQKERVMAALDDAEAHWQESFAHVDVGTIALASALGYLDFRFADWAWRSGRPALAAFHTAFSKRPSMTSTEHAVPA